MRSQVVVEAAKWHQRRKTREPARKVDGYVESTREAKAEAESAGRSKDTNAATV